MKIKIEFLAEKEYVFLKTGYNALIQALIYDNLSDKLSDELHNKGFIYEKRSFKLFNFSSILEKGFFYHQTKTFKFPQKISFYVSSPVDYILEDMAQNFIDEIIDESEVNTPFYQRTLKSFEGMVEYCSFYDEFHPNGSQKKMPLANIRNIERILRQAIDNYGAKADAKTGEI